MTSLHQQRFWPRPRRVTSAPGQVARDTPRQYELNPGWPEQGYTIELGPDAVVITHRDPAGRRYADQTMDQLLRLTGDTPLPCGRIEDHPDVLHRGLMLDISRDRVPTMASLFRLVEQLASFKYNHLELYTEHTFAYRHHPEVWQHASPMTAEEIRALDAHAQRHGIELVPNQNSFGHLARWLKHPRYRDLAEAPDGHTAWGQWRPYPFSFNPLDPRCLTLLEEWYDELLPNFSSRRFNVGCDETVDLGQGRSKAACEARGKGRVYLDFLHEVYRRVSARGRTMHFWGDIILHHPECIPELPRDAVALVWGYEADHPFERECAAFAQSGLQFWVCPGTSTWNSFVGRTSNMLENIRAAAASGRTHGARGFLLTDWGDNGHPQPPVVSVPAYLFGAGQAWCAETNPADALADALDAHVFARAGQGEAVLALGDLHQLTGVKIHNTALPFRALVSDDPTETLRQTTPEQLAGCRASLERLRLELPDGDVSFAARLFRAGLLRAQSLRAGDQEADAELKRLLPDLIDEYRNCWQATSRPGGLEDSIGFLRRRMT